MTSRVFAAIGNFSVRFRWPIVIGWIVITIFSVKAFPGLSDVAKDSQSSFLPANSPSVQAEDLAQPFQDSQHGIATLVVGARERDADGRGHPGRSPPMETTIRAIPGVLRVQDFGLSPDKHAEQAQVVTDAPAVQRRERRDLARRGDPAHLSRATQAGSQFHLTGTIPGIRRPAESVEELAGQHPGVLAALHHRAAAHRVPSAARAADDAPAGCARARARESRHRRRNASRRAGVRDHAVHPHRAGTRCGDRLRIVPRVPNARGTAARTRTQGRGAPRCGDRR